MRAVIVPLGLVVILALVACSGAPSAAPTSAQTAASAAKTEATSAASTASAKVWKVGADPDFKPTTFADASGKLIGVDPEIASAMAKKMGVELQYMGVAWDGIIPALQAGQIDSITSMVITDQRKEKVDFTDPFLQQGVTTVVSADRPASFSPGKDDLKGLKVGVQVNTSASTALGKIPGLNVAQYNTLEDEFSDLMLGRLDVAVVETMAAGYSSKLVHPGKLRVTNKALTDSPTLEGAAVRKGDSFWLKAENDALKALVADGTIDAIMKKWYGDIPYKPQAQ